MSIMSNDQRDISSKLRFMNPQTLREYGNMHKTNPYIFPLVFQESQNRQRLNMYQQAAQGMQPQPKVNEQALAQMASQQLPEDQGIATLAAPNMQQMADGGIAGYDDADFVSRSEPVVMMAGGGYVQGYDRGGAVKTGPEFMRFLKSMGVDLVEFAAMSDEAKSSYMEMFERGKAAPAAAPTSATPTTTTAAAAAAPEEPRRLRKISERVGGLGSTAVKTARKFTPAGLGIEALTSMGDYKTQAPDGIDTSLAGTASDLLRGEFGRAGTGLVRGLGEAAADVGSFGANVLDYVVPGKAPVSTAYEKFLADNTNLQGPRARAVANVPPAPSGGDLRGQLNRADATRFATPGVDNAPAAAGPGTSASPSAVPSSVLSSSTLANTGGGRGGPSLGASAGRDSPDIFSLEGLKATRDKVRGNNDYEIGALKNQLVDINSRANAQVQARLDLRKKEIADEGDIYKDRSDRLAARGKRLEDQEGQNMGLALLNAGLAIMSTPGSLATAIGKGAQVGTAQYAAGIDKLRAAQERLDDAKERIDELRLNRKDLNAREIRGLEKDRDSALMDSEKAIYGFAKDNFNLNRGDADKLFDKYISAQEKKYEQDQMTKRTLATINASNDGRTKQLWAGLMQKHGNDPVAAAKEYNAIEAGDKTTVAAEKLVQDRVGEWEKANKMRLSLMTPAEQAAEIRSAEKRLRNDIYTQLKLTPTMGAGASGDSRFKFLGVTPTQ